MKSLDHFKNAELGSAGPKMWFCCEFIPGVGSLTQRTLAEPSICPHCTFLFPSRWIFLWAGWQICSSRISQTDRGCVGHPRTHRRSVHTHQLPGTILLLQSRGFSLYQALQKIQPFGLLYCLCNKKLKQVSGDVLMCTWSEHHRLSLLSFSFLVLQGNKYWRFNNDVLDGDYPRDISVGFDGIPDGVNAAFALPTSNHLGRERAYFFKGILVGNAVFVQNCIVFVFCFA